MCETVMAVSQLDTESHAPENGFVTPETSKSPGLLSQTDGGVLPSVGGFGKYQKQLIVLTWIPAIFIGFSQFSDNFLLTNPCPEPHNNSSQLLTVAPTAVSTVFTGVNAEAASQCNCTPSSYKLQNGLEQNIVTKWNLVCDSAWKIHIAKFSLLVGSIFGYLVLGVLADWFGRHPVLILSVVFLLVFGMTVAFSVNLPMFGTLRFFEGFCLAGITLSLYVLRIELCLPGWRFSITMVANFMMLAGQLLMPGLAALCRDWQILQAVIVCPLLLMLSYIWAFPESLRWLLATQQYSRSKWIMERISKKNNINLQEDAEELMTELNGALQKQPKKTCIVKMVGTRNLWKNIVVLCVNSLTGYGIHHCFARSMMEKKTVGFVEKLHDFYAEYYVMAVIAVASCVFLCPAVALMGRRGGLLMFMIITALASLLQLGLLNLLGKYGDHLSLVHSDELNDKFSVAFSIIGMFSSHAVSNLSIFFCAEITPSVIRGGGLGLVLASAGFGMLTSPIMELHNQKGYFLHHIIFACCTLICIICILLLPETRNQPLPETLSDGESYTRQPLLPPRKPGEQRLLLTKSESREYARVGDTPLHEAAATVVSTMDSTASSAVDIHMLIDAPIQQEPAQVQLLSMETLTSSQGQDELKQSVEEHPKSVLGTIPNTSTPLAVNSIPKSKRPESPPDDVLAVLSFAVEDASLIIHPVPTGLPLILDSVVPPAAVGSPLEVGNEVDSIESKRPESLPDDVLAVLSSPIEDTSLTIHPVPSELPSILDTVIPATVGSPLEVNNEEDSTDSVSPPIDLPLCALTQSNNPSSIGQSPNLLNDIPPSSSIDSHTHPVSEILPPSPTELSMLDPSSQMNAAPPIDSGTPLLQLDAPPELNSIESAPPSLSNGSTSLLAAHATSTDSDSVTESGNPLMVNSTVSSPIDSGLPSDVDLPNTANGGTSS